MIEFRGKFNASVTKALNYRQMKKLWWVYLAFSLLFIVLGGMAVIFPEDSADYMMGFFFMGFGVLFTPLCVGLTFLIQRLINKSMPVMSDDSIETFQFTEEGIAITLVKGEEYNSVTNAKYSYLFKVEESRDFYFLRISRVQSHVVRKADLTQGSIAELNALLTASLGARFKPCPRAKKS